MNWKVLLMAGVLLLAPVAVAEQDSSASGDDETSTSNSGTGNSTSGGSSEPTGEQYGLAGWFDREVNQTNKEEFKRIVAEFNGRVTGMHYHEEERAIQFGVDSLASLSHCEQLWQILDRRDYIDKVEDCRVTHNADGTTAERPPEEEQKPDPEPVPHEEEEHKDEPRDEETHDDQIDPERHEEAAKCSQIENAQEKEECFDDYCDDPHPDHADQCKRFRQYQEEREAREDQEEARTEFRTCREGASTASDRQECAADYADEVGEDDDRWEREQKIAAAKQAGKVGARVNLKAMLAAEDVEEYDVDVEVITDGAKAGKDDADFRVTVSAELTEGRTIVLDVDPELLSGPTLVIRYFDVWDDGTETEVIIRQATDLADVLDPTDDNGQPEFWVVSDVNGLQLMASVPHWSVHAITVQGIGEFVSAPSVIAGIIFGVVGSVMAAAVLFKPRKGDDL